MLPQETARHHRIKVIIISIIVVPIALFLMLLIVGFVANVLERSQRISRGDYNINSTAQQTPTASYSGAERELIEGLASQSFGANEPVVTIVEFADFACPYCKQSHLGLRELSLRYKDQVKIIWRDWPGHQNSIPLAYAAYCAGEQGRFWEMHDKLYQKQSDTFGSDKNDLAQLALELGVYNEQFQNCFDSTKFLPLIKKNFADSQTLGVQGTPTWFINGEKIEGALTNTELEQIIQTYVTK